MNFREGGSYRSLGFYSDCNIRLELHYIGILSVIVSYTIQGFSPLIKSLSRMPEVLTLILIIIQHMEINTMHA